MPSSILELLLSELKKTNLFSARNIQTQIQSNSNNTCLIPFPEGVEVQLEIDRQEKNLLVISILGELKPGNYRNRIFREALIANGLPPPRYGILAFSKKTSQLVLFAPLDLRELNGAKVEAFLPNFVEMVKVWKQAIEQGNIPSPSSYAPAAQISSPLTKGLFGLLPK